MDATSLLARALIAGLGAAVLLGAPIAASAQPATAAAEAAYPDSWTHFQALKARAKGGLKHTHATMPDWTGIWIRQAPRGQGGSFDLGGGPIPGLVGYGVSGAVLTPKYKEAYEAKLAKLRAGHEWDRLSWCLPAGFPRWLTEPLLREFIVTPDQVWLTHEQINETRRIYTDGREHIPDDQATPLWMGDSIGFWDGDTLVIHTNHLKAGEYQRGQPDFSFQITTVEEMRKVDPDTVEIRVTVYDPPSLLRPYKAVFTYRKDKTPGLRVHYAACEENNNVYRTPEGGSAEHLPGEPQYRDASTFGIPEVALDTLPE